MAERLRLALVGCGAISKMHLIGLRAGAPRSDVVATVDVDRARAEELAKETGASAVFTSLEEALAHGDFDAVDLMLPHQRHERAAIAAFAAGKHVLLEKPMAPTPDACDRILAAARTAGTVFMVGENAQYWPEVLLAKQAIERGAIGEIVTARASILFPPLAAYYGDRAWRLDRAQAGGGIAIDTGSHWLRPLRMWLGEVDEAIGALGRPYAKMEGESLVRALLRFRSGVVASFDALLSDAPLAPDLLFRVLGTQGEIAIDGLGRALHYHAGNRKGEPLGPPGGYLHSYRGEFADFEAAVLDGTALAAGPESALGELRTALAIYRSAESGRFEKVWA